MSPILAWTIIIVFLLVVFSPLIYCWIKQHKESPKRLTIEEYPLYDDDEVVLEEPPKRKVYVPPALTRKYVEVNKDDSPKEIVAETPVFSYSKYIKTKHPYNHLITSKNRKFLTELSYYLYWKKYEKLRQNATEMLLRPTQAEYILYNYLNKIKIDFIPQCICVTKYWYIMDCYLPKYHINIEIDGGYHFTKEQNKNDWNWSKEIYKTYEIKTYRFTNDQIINFVFIEKLNKLLK